jgi:hypothetical protein
VLCHCATVVVARPNLELFLHRRCGGQARSCSNHTDWLSPPLGSTTPTHPVRHQAAWPTVFDLSMIDARSCYVHRQRISPSRAICLSLHHCYAMLHVSFFWFAKSLVGGLSRSPPAYKRCHHLLPPLTRLEHACPSRVLGVGTASSARPPVDIITACATYWFLLQS